MMTRKNQTCKPLHRFIIVVSALLLFAAGCENFMSPDTAQTSSGQTSADGAASGVMDVQISFPSEYVSPNGRSLTVSQVQLVALSNDGLIEKRQSLAYDTESATWQGTVYLDAGHWLVSGSATDSAGTVLFSGYREINGAVPPLLRLNLLRETGGLKITAIDFSAGSFETLRVSASRETFPNIVAQAEVSAQDPSASVHLLNLTSGTWQLLVQGLIEEEVYYQHSYSVVVETNRIIERELPIFIQKVSPVRFSPENGALVDGSLTVVLSTPTSGAQIRYTLDNSTPTQTFGTRYIGPLTISSQTTIKAVAYLDDNSATASNVVSRVMGTTLGIPQNISAVSGNNAISVSWDALEGAAGYQLAYSQEEVLSPSHEWGQVLASTGAQISGLLSGTTYYVWVRAVDQYGSWHNPSLPASAATLPPRIVFNANGGQGLMSDQVIPEGESAALNPVTFSRSAYTFSSWNTAAAGTGTSYADMAELVMSSESIHLYAIWVPTIQTISFDANGAEGTMLPQTVETDATVFLNKNTYTKAASYFAGWATSSSGTTSYADRASFTMGTENVTLYTTWVPLRTIRFDANGGTGTMPDQQTGQGYSVNLAAAQFAHAGYVFTGWNTASDGSGTSYANAGSITLGAEDMLLYATWEPFVVEIIAQPARVGHEGTYTASISPASIVDGSKIRWDWTNDGFWDTTWNSIKTINYAYTTTGTYTIKLAVQEPSGLIAIATQIITVSEYYLPDFSMVQVPSGTFNNGTADVTLSSFKMQSTEVTQVQWQAVMGSNPASGYGVGDTYPVYNVNWYDALVFCNKLSILEGKTPVYSISGSTNPDDWGTAPTTGNSTWDAAIMNMAANGYRLPTEAEWEYAARGGAPVESYEQAGSDSFGEVGWYNGNSNLYSHPVAEKVANRLGLYDMSGNVSEWCWDWYGDYASGAQTNPRGAASGSYRVMRGGSFASNDYYMKVVDRLSEFPQDIGNLFKDHGFRMVLQDPIPLSSISLSPDSMTIAIGQSQQIIATLGPVDVNQTGLSWTSSNSSVASVSETGMVIANGIGTATITCTTVVGSLTKTCSVEVNYSGLFVEVPGGTFNNGTADVTLSSFMMQTTELTQAQYIAVMGSNPGYSAGVGATYPVYSVSWYDTLVFCNKLSILEGKTPVYSISGSTDPNVWGTVPTSSNSTWNAAIMNMSASGYRLPTEAEWEYAARGGAPVASYVYAGSNNVDEVAWWWENSGGHTQLVATKAPNRLGLYDMSGNVWEWCWDWYGSYPGDSQTDPTGPSSGAYRMKRGGSWNSSADYATVSDRSYYGPAGRNSLNGFRLVLPVVQE